MIPTSEVSKPWQSMGSPPTAFKPKKPFMPRLVRSKNPDHIIGYGSVFQVGDDDGVDAKQRHSFTQLVADASDTSRRLLARSQRRRTPLSRGGRCRSRACTIAGALSRVPWRFFLVDGVADFSHQHQYKTTKHTTSRTHTFCSLCLGYVLPLWPKM